MPTANCRQDQESGWRVVRYKGQLARQSAIFGVLLLGLAGIVGRSAGAEERLQVDGEKSAITFSLTDTLHAVKGNFAVASGAVSMDPKTGAMGGLITVNATSGHRDSPARDRRMVRDELKAKLFPTITFAPQHFTGAWADEGDSTLQVTGVFTLLGHAHTITVPMNVAVEHGQATAQGEFPVPYVAWGLPDPSVLFLRVGKVVTIGIRIVGSVTE